MTTSLDNLTYSQIDFDRSFSTPKYYGIITDIIVSNNIVNKYDNQPKRLPQISMTLEVRDYRNFKRNMIQFQCSSKHKCKFTGRFLLLCYPKWAILLSKATPCEQACLDEPGLPI